MKFVTGAELIYNFIYFLPKKKNYLLSIGSGN